MQKGKNFVAVPLDQAVIDTFLQVGMVVLHAVFFGEALDLAVAEHR